MHELAKNDYPRTAVYKCLGRDSAESDAERKHRHVGQHHTRILIGSEGRKG